MRIKHDIHTHTLSSNCCHDPRATVAAFVERASELGHKVLGISNHVWDERVEGSNSWYRGQSIDFVLEARMTIPEDTRGVKVLFGAETEYCGMSDTLGMLASTAKRFDYILVPHSHTHMKNFVMADDADTLSARATVTERLSSAFPELSDDSISKMASVLKRADLIPMVDEPVADYVKYVSDFMLDSFEALMRNPEFVEMARSVQTIIAHPFCPCGEDKPTARKMMEAVLSQEERLMADLQRAASLNVAMDVNLGAFRFPEDGYSDDPMVKLFRMALDAGCKFAFGTDTHSLAGLDNISRADAIADAIGITEEDLIDIVR